MDLRETIRKYVETGGRDAFAFSMVYSYSFGDVPGEKIQRMIDEEVSKREKELLKWSSIY